MVRLAPIVLAVIAGVAAGFAACGTDAVGIEACREIESARCTAAAPCEKACTINMSIPPHRNSPTTDVQACQQYYDVACLHGLEATSEPGDPAVQSCINAINVAAKTCDCNTILHPETNPACAFLIPPPPTPPEAGTDGDATTDGTEAAATEAGE